MALCHPLADGKKLCRQLADGKRATWQILVTSGTGMFEHFAVR